MSYHRKSSEETKRGERPNPLCDIEEGTSTQQVPSRSLNKKVKGLVEQWEEDASSCARQKLKERNPSHDTVPVRAGGADKESPLTIPIAAITTPLPRDEGIRAKKVTQPELSPSVAKSVFNNEPPSWVSSQGKSARDIEEASNAAFKELGFFDISEEEENPDTKEGIDWRIRKDEDRRVGFPILWYPDEPVSNQEDPLSCRKTSSSLDAEVVVPMTVLRTQQCNVKPGAFHIYPGGRTRSDAEGEDVSAHHLAVSQLPAHQESGSVPNLVEAYLVDEEEAKPSRRLWPLLLIAALLTVAALVVGLSLGLTREGTSPPPPTAAPTVRSVPIGELVDEFLSSLPNETNMAINGEDRFTPQNRAFHWLTSDEQPPIPDDDEALMRMTQMFAMVTLYYATGGDSSWELNTGWLDYSLQECEWVTCLCTNVGSSSSFRILQSLDLRGNGLVGTLPREVGLLSPALELLDAASNSLTGSLPTELGELSNLIGLLDLGQNQFTGTIPTELGDLVNLEKLHLSNNALMGSLPTELAKLSSTLNHLELQENGLSGTIPTELGSLSHIQRVWLNGNQLAGSIPTEVGLQTNLQQLWLHGNSLTGPIPTEIGSLRYLQELFMHGNQLGGSMPAEICALIETNALNVTIDCNLIQCDCGCTCAT